MLLELLFQTPGQFFAVELAGVLSFGEQSGLLQGKQSCFKWLLI